MNVLASNNGGNEVDEENLAEKRPKLKLLPLIFLIYFEVSGGPFGEEPAVKGGGPLFAILGFLIFPFIWSIPEALITAELATAYPGNGGFVIWATRAFGPFWGSMMGSMKFLSGVINNASYPILFNSYLKLVFPSVAHGWPGNVSTTCFNLILAFLNYLGLSIVGYTAFGIGVISLTPFLIMAAFSIPRIKPHRWVSLGKPELKKDWNLYVNTLFWNLNFWDNASTLAGEVDNPQTTFPKALFSAGLLTCIGYLIPLLASTGALPVDYQDQWDNGFLADAAGIITGHWLKVWVEVGATLSIIGLFEAQLSSSSFQLLGMADLGFIPKFFSLRSTWFNTPWVGILVSSLISLSMSFNDFNDIIASANFLYLLGMLLELASFLILRSKYPSLHRPYKVPLGMTGCIIMCSIPGVFLLLLMWISTKRTYQVCGAFTFGSILAYFVFEYLKAKKWFEFSKDEGAEEAELETDGVNLESA